MEKSNLQKKSPCKPYLVIISCPSGVGKSTVIQILLERILCLEFAKSVSTRPPRENEKEYFFVKDKNSFLNWPGGYLEMNRYNKHFYGTPLSEIKRILKSGKTPLLDIDINGFQQIQALGEYNIISFYLTASPDLLYKRLLYRNTEPISIILQRLSISAKEMNSPILEDYLHIIETVEERTPEETANTIEQLLSQEL